METITLKINESTKAGKVFKEMLEVVYSKQKGIEIVEEKSPKPNKETIKAMRELKNGKGVKFNSVDELFKSI
ncbi:MAG: type II toxin-antitoxin system RelB/DinJ family antitoxin [Bergeyella sp.]